MKNLKISTSEIARICNVSQGTVDRALNNRMGIKAATKEKIIQVAKKFGYRDFANTEKHEVSGQVGVIIFNLENEYFSELVTEIEHALREEKLGTIIMMSHYDKQYEIECIRSLYNMGVDGIILCTVNCGEDFDNYLKLFDIPIVSVGNIAQKIASGDVPEKLCDVSVYLLDLASVVAGTQYRGQFESRLKAIVEDAKRLNVVLVIDEIHSIVKAGDADGAMNAANILKPALAKGDIQVIGATTLDEYRKYIEKDAALERRFQPVIIDEPSVEDTIEIIKGTKDYYESFHNITIDDFVIKDAVVLSTKYINDRFLPDKAIDVIDEAASRINMDNPFSPKIIELKKELTNVVAELEKLEADSENPLYEEIAKQKTEKYRLESQINEMRASQRLVKMTVDDIAKVIELWTGIPVKNITETDKNKLLNLEDRLHERIIGQHKAVESVSRAVRRNRALKMTKKRPVSFIFVGPTGVGKTELVKALTACLFDDEASLIRLDMSEYMEKHAVAKITGAPPGYVGYDDGGQLTEKVRRKPYSVILLDEIEKAHPDVFNILLQILDDGRITDSQGRCVNFENTVIIMTSNAGTSVGSAKGMGFGADQGKMSDRIEKSLKEIFRPEFLNRVDEVIEFKELTRDELFKICDLMLKDLIAELKAMGIGFEITENAKQKLLDDGYNPRFGARPIRREIQTQIEDAVSSILLGDAIPENSTIVVDATQNEMIITVR